MDISFLRALKAPCNCCTSVFSVSATARFGESAVFMVMVFPARLMMTPLTFRDCAAAPAVNTVSTMSDKTTAGANLRMRPCFITYLSPVARIRPTTYRRSNLVTREPAGCRVEGSDDLLKHSHGTTPKTSYGLRTTAPESHFCGM